MKRKGVSGPDDGGKTESGFPFACDNRKCGKKYNPEDLAHLMMLWGYIYLTNGEESLIGFTCPDCWHTTLKKYRFAPEPLKMTTEWRDGQIYFRSNKEQGGLFVPFSLKILESQSLIRVCPNLSKRFLCEIATYLSFSPCEQGQ